MFKKIRLVFPQTHDDGALKVYGRACTVLTLDLQCCDCAVHLNEFICAKRLHYDKGLTSVSVNSGGRYRRVFFLLTDLITAYELNSQFNAHLLPRKTKRSIISYHGDQQGRKSTGDETRRMETTD